MSQENVKTVLDAIAAFNRGGPDAWSEFFADDIDYRAVEGGIDDPGPIRDRDTLRVYGQDWLDTFDDSKTCALHGKQQSRQLAASLSRSGGSESAPAIVWTIAFRPWRT